MEYNILKTGIFIKDNTKVGSLKEKDYIYGKMELHIKDISVKEKEMVKVYGNRVILKILKSMKAVI